MIRLPFLALSLLVAIMAMPSLPEAAVIAWSNFHPPWEGGPKPALDSRGDPLPGTSAFGPMDLSKGALVQLIKAVGGAKIAADRILKWERDSEECVRALLVDTGGALRDLDGK